MRNLDTFYAANDSTARTHQNFSLSIVGDTTLRAEGVQFEVVANSVSLETGQLVKLVDSAPATDVEAYCVVTRRADSTHWTLRPVRSASDVAVYSDVPGTVVGHEFPAATTTVRCDSTTPRILATAVVDLTESPAETCTYALLAGGYQTVAAAGGTVSAWVRQSPTGDPATGTDRNLSVWSLPNADDDSATFCGGSSVVLTGGQRYEFHLMLAGYGGVVATGHNPRLLALRVDGTSSVSAGDGATGLSTTSSESWQTHLSVTAPATGDYLLVGSWALSHDTIGKAGEAYVTAGATSITQQIYSPHSVTDYWSAGVAAKVSLDKDAVCNLQFRRSAGGSGQTGIRNGYLGLLALRVDDFVGQSDYVGATESHTSWDTLHESSAVTIESGAHLELVSCTLSSSSSYNVRPVWGNSALADPSGLGLSGIPHSQTIQNPIWFLHRNQRRAGSTTNKLEMESVSGSVVAENLHYAWLRERAALPITPTTETAIVCDVETGLALKNWGSTTTANRFRKRLPDVQLISRALVNGVELAQAASEGGLAAMKWFFDASTKDLFVQLDAGDTPADDDINLIVVALLLLARQHADLVDKDGATRPYASRVKSVPGATQALTSRNGCYGVSTTLGTLEIASADGEFDEKLVRRSWEGFRVRVRRGYPSLSANLEDFETVGFGVLGLPASDFDSVRLRLFDKGLLLNQPVAQTSVAVKEGFGADARTREDQQLAVLFGPNLRRVPAYRLEDNEGSTDWNLYQICANPYRAGGVHSVYELADSRTGLSGNHSKIDYGAFGAYITAGRIRIQNTAWSVQTEPPDVVYLDLAGLQDYGLAPWNFSLSATPDTPGEIAEYLLRMAGLDDSDLILPTFRDLDRKWRQRFDVVTKKLKPEALEINLVVEGKETFAQALTRLLCDVGAYWYVNRQGRIGVGVPDLDVGNVVGNGSFEDDATVVYPWRVGNGATLATTTSRKYDGLRSAETSNGTSPTGDECLVQDILLPHGGTYAVTLLCSLLSGSVDKMRVSVVRPDGVEVLSEPQVLETGSWSRVSLAVDIPQGAAGVAEIRIYPAHASSTQTAVAVDNVEMYPVVAVASDHNSNPLSLEFEPETYFEAAVSYNVNTQDTNRASKVVVRDDEARGLSTATSESLNVVQSAKRLDLGVPLLSDGESAAGVAAPLVVHFGRMRHRLSIDLFGLDRIPVVGDYLFHVANRRIPELSNEYPIWRLVEVKYSGKDASVVRVEAERQVDPVTDRTDISPDDIPMGAIALTRSASAPTDFSVVSDLEGSYVAGATVPDVSTARGEMVHVHQLDHSHALQAHSHTTAPLSESLSNLSRNDDRPAGWRREAVKNAAYPSFVGPIPEEFFEQTMARGYTDGGHSHSFSSDTPVVASASATSTSPSIVTGSAGNYPPFRRVHFVQRTEATFSTIPTDLVVGFPSAALPAGWERDTGLDGYYLLGATTRQGASTTIKASTTWTPNPSYITTLSLTSNAGVGTGSRLTITDGTNTTHAIVAQFSGSDLIVWCLNEVGDDNSVSYSAGDTVTVDSEAVDVTGGAASHNHGGAVPSHTHTAVHSHGRAGRGFLESSDTGIACYVKYPRFWDEDTQAVDYHRHTLRPKLPPDGTTSSSAAGSGVSGAALVADFYELVWMRPSDANLNSLPAGSVLLWSQGENPPTGYSVVGEADGLILKGAAAASDPVSSTTPHTHTFDVDAHSISHNHGGNQVTHSGGQYVSAAGGNYHDPGMEGENGIGSPGYVGSTGTANINNPVAMASAADYRWDDGNDRIGAYDHLDGHFHEVTISVTTESPSLSAATGVKSGGPSNKPPHRRLLVIRKD